VNVEPQRLDPPSLALRLLASRGAAAYLAYLVEAAATGEVFEEIVSEIRAFDASATIASVGDSPSAARLLEELPKMDAEILLIAAPSYEAADWTLLDVRRSALERDGVMVFVTTPVSFASLMRVAPNLASWLGGFVFSRHVDDEAAQTEAERSQRLDALRVWAGKSDREVIEAAERGELPRDPEYAEWLVLLGRGDILDV
jgi:hypothetical protein